MKSRPTGFTIVELMITLLVLSILMAAAVPTFRDFTRNNRVTAAQNNLVTAMSVARSTALRHSSDVVLCPVATEGDIICASNTDWSKGWLVWDAAAPAPLIQAWPAPGGDVTTTSTVNDLTYQATGTVVTTAEFTVAYQGCTGKKAHKISLTLVGSPQAELDDC